MALSNTTVPIYYGRFRDEVLAGRIPVCREVAMEMNRIDEMIANPNYYYDDGLSAELQITSTHAGWVPSAATHAARVARIEAHLWPARRRLDIGDTTGS